MPLGGDGGLAGGNAAADYTHITPTTDSRRQCKHKENEKLFNLEMENLLYTC